MVILLYGPNAYARDKKERELIDAARQKYPDALYAVFDMEDEASAQNAYNFLFDTGLFAQGKKIIRLSHINSISDISLINRMLQRAQSKDVLCMVHESWPKKELTIAQKKIFLDVTYSDQFFPHYSSTQATKELLYIAHGEGVVLDTSAVARVYVFAGNDMYGAYHELTRLSLLTNHITISFLNTLPEYAETREVFEFARSVVSGGSLPHRLELWEYMKSQHVEPFLIFGYLAKMAKKEPLIRALARADELVKTGRLDMDQALEEIVIS
ncbi:MAG: hypothetical protein M1320_02160 [Patescibacteria group bacterium]|nr:hypothetical protein [Patescibacteria group bacterium]